MYTLPYSASGNFGEVFNLAIWQIWYRSPKLVNFDKIDAYKPMALSIQIAKFKFRQLRAISPNLMLTKVTAMQYNILTFS